MAALYILNANNNNNKLILLKAFPKKRRSLNRANFSQDAL
jgi:hypothetical protein